MEPTKIIIIQRYVAGWTFVYTTLREDKSKQYILVFVIIIIQHGPSDFVWYIMGTAFYYARGCGLLVGTHCEHRIPKTSAFVYTLYSYLSVKIIPYNVSRNFTTTVKIRTASYIKLFLNGSPGKSISNNHNNNYKRPTSARGVMVVVYVFHSSVWQTFFFLLNVGHTNVVI